MTSEDPAWTPRYSEVSARGRRRPSVSGSTPHARGLIVESRRKSMQPMGHRLGIDCQQLQQFVSSSPWPFEPVRRALVRRAVHTITPEARVDRIHTFERWNFLSGLGHNPT